jgi:alpha-beta hydrolase superfamily lysophospholipase
MSTSQTARALYLHTGGGAVFAILHAGAGPRRQSAVLLCPPFGWEDMCSYRSRRDWAEHLARSGYPTLRIDLPGSGDSAGSPTDPDRLDAWTQAVAGAARWLLETSGASRIVALGIGLGGMMAYRATTADAPIDELILWSVPAQGRTLVRELRVFSALEVANIRDVDDPKPAAAAAAYEDGALVANGYLMSAETVAQLEQLDLAQLQPPPAGQLRRGLLLWRDGLKVDRALHEALEASGAEVELVNGPGYGAMMVEPQDARPPTEVFALVDAWLAKGETSRLDPASSPLDTAPTQAGPADTGGIAAEEELRLVCAGIELRETPVYFDGPEGRLFGVLAEPLGERLDLCAVLLNAGPQRRTGPNRMWVEIARRWAARGVPTLRFDVAAIGDSDGDSAALVRVASLYTPEYVAQARAALDTLADRGLPARFLMLGLCSGAYWSVHAALQDERITAVVMLNPRALIWDEFVYAVRRTRELRERLLLASTWRKVLTGEITLARHLETGRALAGRALSSPLRARERILASRRGDGRREVEPVEGLLDGLRDRDQRALLLFTGSEPLRRELTEQGVFDHLDRWPNLELVLTGTSANTHTLTPLWLQREVHELVDRALERELERLPGG